MKRKISTCKNIKTSNHLHLALLILLVFVINLSLSEISVNNKNNSIIAKHRTRRHLTFQNGTRFLFRINVKENIIKVNQIFAHGYGFRANIDMLQPPRPHNYFHHHRVVRRDVIETIEQLMIQQGLDGRSCIFKMFCDAAKEPSTESGMLFKLFKLIFAHKSLTEYGGVNIPSLLHNGCEFLENHCPLTLLELTPYTDVV